MKIPQNPQPNKKKKIDDPKKSRFGELVGAVGFQIEMPDDLTPEQSMDCLAGFQRTIRDSRLPIIGWLLADPDETNKELLPEINTHRIVNVAFNPKTNKALCSVAFSQTRPGQVLAYMLKRGFQFKLVPQFEETCPLGPAIKTINFIISEPPHHDPHD